MLHFAAVKKVCSINKKWALGPWQVVRVQPFGFQLSDLSPAVNLKYWRSPFSYSLHLSHCWVIFYWSNHYFFPVVSVPQGHLCYFHILFHLWPMAYGLWPTFRWLLQIVNNRHALTKIWIQEAACSSGDKKKETKTTEPWNGEACVHVLGVVGLLNEDN